MEEGGAKERKIGWKDKLMEFRGRKLLGTKTTTKDGLRVL